MKRRVFITGAGGALCAGPTIAGAQQGEHVRRVGVLLAAYARSDRAGELRLQAFRSALERLGWKDERNIRLDYRWGAGNLADGNALAAELVRAAPDVIVVAGDPALAELHRLTDTIPIVFTQVSDPVDSGFVASLARAGGNVTGFQNFEPEIGGKWLDVLREVTPRMRRVSVLLNSATPPHKVFLRAVEAAASALALSVTTADIRNASEIEQAIARFGGEPASPESGMPESGMIVFPHPLTIANRNSIIALAARHRLPTIYPYRYFATDGGLVAYGPDQIDQWRGAAGYVDRILRGEKPAGLPVQMPLKYEMVINLRAAKALGLDLSAMVLARAEEVIE